MDQGLSGPKMFLMGQGDLLIVPPGIRKWVLLAHSLDTALIKVKKEKGNLFYNSIMPISGTFLSQVTNTFT